MKKLEGIQFLRGIAALVVVAYHICALSVDYTAGAIYRPFVMVGNAGVDLFFVISGFLMVCTTFDRFDAPGTAIRFAIHRLSRILPPYWILTTLVLIFYLYDPSAVNSKHGGVDVFRSYFLLPSRQLPLVPVAWTLEFEMLFYAIFFVGISVLDLRRLSAALFLWAALISLNVLSSTIGGRASFDLIFLHPYNLEFISGCAIGLWHRRRGTVSHAACVGIIAVAAAAFVVLAMYFEIAIPPYLSPVQRVVFFLAPVLLLVFGCLGLAFRRDGIVGFVTRAGDYSYSLYLTHILVAHSAYRIVAQKLSISLSPGQNLAFGAGIFVACIVVANAFFRFVERPSCSATLRLLTGLQSRYRIGATSLTTSNYAGQERSADRND